MKRVFFILAILVSGTIVSFAQKEEPITVSAVTKASEIETVTGKVESVTLADSSKGIKSEIVIIDENGQKYIFLVKFTTTIYATDWKAISLEKINKGDSAKIKYSTTKEGVNEAVSINLIK